MVCFFPEFIHGIRHLSAVADIDKCVSKMAIGHCSVVFKSFLIVRIVLRHAGICSYRIVRTERRRLEDVPVVVLDVDDEGVRVQPVRDTEALVDGMKIGISFVTDTDQEDLPVLFIEAAQAGIYRGR